MSRAEDLQRIEDALDAAEELIRDLQMSTIGTSSKAGGDPVTEADLAVDSLLRELLPRAAEGWLSEETADDPDRLDKRRVWVVDPIDGTREFIQRLPEWCVSIGLLEDGEPVAGGVTNPGSGERVVGAVGEGIRYRGTHPFHRSDRLAVAASRSEVSRGEWQAFERSDIELLVSGSVAYKTALVAAGVVDATWTLVPKHEWDVAAGAALVLASGGWVSLSDGSKPVWNQPRPWLPGFIATSEDAKGPVEQLLLS